MTEKKTGDETLRLCRTSIDEEELSERVAKALSYGNDRSKKFAKWKHVKPKHNIIVIDEVDQFNTCEKGFTLLVKTILNN